MSDEAKPDPQPTVVVNTNGGSSIKGVPVGLLYDLITKFTVQLAFIGLLVFIGWASVNLPPQWIVLINKGVETLQANWIASEKSRDDIRAARDKEIEMMRASAMDRFNEGQKAMTATIKELSDTNKGLMSAVEANTRQVAGRIFTTPKKQPDAAKSADAKNQPPEN